MDSVPLWRKWSFWRRVLLFASGVLVLAGQMLSVTAQQAQWLAFGVAVVNLAASLIPDVPSETVAAARGLMK
jgi:uncharacterized membrane protein SirB2